MSKQTEQERWDGMIERGLSEVHDSGVFDRTHANACTTFADRQTEECFGSGVLRAIAEDDPNLDPQVMAYWKKQYLKALVAITTEVIQRQIGL